MTSSAAAASSSSASCSSPSDRSAAASPGARRSLLVFRAVQGLGAAIAAPTALSLIATEFPEGKERNRAMGVYAAMSGAGAAVGLILGGFLTEIDWRWVMFVNVPIGIFIALVAPRALTETERHTGKFDLPGAITATARPCAAGLRPDRGGHRASARTRAGSDPSRGMDRPTQHRAPGYLDRAARRLRPASRPAAGTRSCRCESSRTATGPAPTASC